MAARHDRVPRRVRRVHRLLHALVFMVVGGVAPLLILYHKKGARMRAFSEEFPDALDLG